MASTFSVGTFKFIFILLMKGKRFTFLGLFRFGLHHLSTKLGRFLEICFSFFIYSCEQLDCMDLSNFCGAKKSDVKAILMNWLVTRLTSAVNSFPWSGCEIAEGFRAIF